MACSPAVRRKSCLKAGLKEKLREELKEAFNIFDNEGMGLIDMIELKVAIRALGYHLTLEDIMLMTPEINSDRSGKIDFGDFLTVMMKLMTEGDSKEDMVKSFHLFADEETGTIGFHNLKRVARELGEELTDEELQEMIDRVDQDGDGQVDLKDFLHMMKHINL